MSMTDDELLNLPETDFSLSEDVQKKLGIIENQPKEAESADATMIENDTPTPEVSVGSDSYEAINKKSESPSKENENPEETSQEVFRSYLQAHDIYHQAKKVEENLSRLLRDSPNNQALRKAIDTYKEAELSQILSELSVDELKRKRRGIRVSALWGAGITNISQLRKYSYNRLLSIYGIGEVSASLILSEVNSIVLEQQSKLELKPFRRGAPYGKRLICECYKYMSLERLYRCGINPLSGQEESLKHLCSLAHPTVNRIVWFFTFSKAKKETALVAAKELSEILSTPLPNKVEMIIQEKKKFYNATEDESWEQYSKNRNAFESVLRKC